MSLEASLLFDVGGRIALVTGGGTGLGLTAALALASNGAKVYISGRRKERLDEAVTSHTSSYTSSVINITSISGMVKVSQSHYAYNASKAAANHLTQMLAHELKFKCNLPLRINAIAPGLFSSEMTSSGKSEKGKTNSEDVKDHFNPAGRVGSEHEYAQVILLLACNTFITGQIIAVDGGFLTAVPANR
ncbi:related to NAD(P)H-dependent oxidoreductase [Ustilago bromivora]|uniref:Related to NAD(P)H-dependent oxidoreductase n=1 Tax=Ustilago bromivora TaxID=307758 RepID=A0A8H8QHU0_9BASI|nr:related to NAD(P)H-dependent oxidoreductase [Ustilago bromivora]